MLVVVPTLMGACGLTYKDHRLSGKQLQGIENCPHCGVSGPLLYRVWASDHHTPRNDGQPGSKWAVYLCTTCGSAVSVKGSPGDGAASPPIDQIFPDVWEPDSVLPSQVKTYLTQAHKTLTSPDASVVMSAASIDAMLKDHQLDEGSLYKRIDDAVDKGVLTSVMAQWAHRVRLDSNNPRHADKDAPHMTADDAKRAFDYAKCQRRSKIRPRGGVKVGHLWRAHETAGRA
jgi:hypothetical protein